MYILAIISFILCIIALAVCWISFWAIPVTLTSLILSIAVFYNYFLGERKNILKRFRGLVFATLILSCMALIGSLIMTGVPVGIFLMGD